MTTRAIDLFAGWGGFTLGAQLAGVRVVWAANHWPRAVEVHSANHPDVAHVCQDLRQADWTALPRYDILLASPACQPHSRASQPKRRAHHDADRATAWAVVDCAEATRPRAIIVENVLAFGAWRLFPVWKQALETLGYKLTMVVLNAAASGVPQRRERLFTVATKRRLPLRMRSQGAPAFGPCIEWDAPGWRPTADASAGARERIAKGRALGRYLVHHVTRSNPVPLHEPIRTITTKDQWAIVDGDRYRPLTRREYARGMGFPDSYTWPASLARHEVLRGLGNAVPPPMARDVITSVLEAA